MRPPTDCSVRKHHFCKILLGDFHQRLKIPPKFMKHIAKEASRRITLQGPNGNNWQAELSETARGNFFSAGWSDFVKDHSLKEHDFLVFGYDGNKHFSVMIFDTTACEREDLLEMKTPKEAACEWKSRQGFQVKQSLDDKYNVQHQPSRNNKPASKQLHGEDVSSNPTRNEDIKPVDADLPIRTTLGKTSYLSRCPVTAEKRLKAQEAANAFHSDFPYIILGMTKSFVCERFMLRFPRSFSLKFLPRNKTNMVLWDPSGKHWTVVYIPSPDRDHLSGGWSAFARGNKLKEGDLCAFEIIRELELRVHIFRVESTPRATIDVKDCQHLPKEEGHDTSMI